MFKPVGLFSLWLYRYRLPLALMILPIAAIAAPMAPSAELPFTAIRKGETLGPHTITISAEGGITTVKISTRFIVKAAFITIFRFEHDSTEVWQNGKLWSLRARTNDNGTVYQIAIQQKDGQLAVDGTRNRKPIHAVLPEMPLASLWGIDLAKGDKLFNTITGKAVTVTIADLGMDKTLVRGKEIATHHFHVSGELVQDDWYDDRGLLVRKLAKAPDGSDIDFLLQ